MIRQFDARYRVTVFSNKETTIVEWPITCKFTVTRGTFSQSNSATIQLYNLAPSTRNQIFQDQLNLDKSKWKYVHLEAGWGNTVSLIFRGRIMQAYSYKSLLTEFFKLLQPLTAWLWKKSASIQAVMRLWITGY